jgi:hypothetical protein
MAFDFIRSTIPTGITVRTQPISIVGGYKRGHRTRGGFDLEKKHESGREGEGRWRILYCFLIVIILH